MYGLYKTLTKPRSDGLAWRISHDARTGAWMSVVVVSDVETAFRHYPQTMSNALNGTSVLIRSQMYAKKYLQSGKTSSMMSYVLANVLWDDIFREKS